MPCWENDTIGKRLSIVRTLANVNYLSPKFKVTSVLFWFHFALGDSELAYWSLLIQSRLTNETYLLCSSFCFREPTDHNGSLNNAWTHSNGPWSLTQKAVIWGQAFLKGMLCVNVCICTLCAKGGSLISLPHRAHEVSQYSTICARPEEPWGETACHFRMTCQDDNDSSDFYRNIAALTLITFGDEQIKIPQQLIWSFNERHVPRMCFGLTVHFNEHPHVGAYKQCCIFNGNT